MASITIKQGDCLSSVASQYGFKWETIWDHPQNAALKQNRQDPNVLMPGDQLFMPEKEVKTEQGATEATHRFRLLGVPAKIKVRMLIDGEARTNLAYSLYVDSALVDQGTTDGDGLLEASIPPNAANGKIVITDDQGNQETYPFDFGTVDPLDCEQGVRGRLFNLGFDTVDLSEAIRSFQQEESIEVTGVVDAATKDKLKEKFGE